MISLASGLRSTQPMPLAATGGQGPQRSTLLVLTPTITESFSSDHTPGPLPSGPPELTSVTDSRLVAKRPVSTAFHIGRTQTPRLRMRVAVKPLKCEIRFCPAGVPSVVGNIWPDAT